MKPVLYYLLQLIVASGILYGYYHLALRNKKFHKYNRFYLLASTIISVTIPFLNIPVYFIQSDTDSSFVRQTLTNFSISNKTGLPINGIADTNWLTLENVTILFYVFVASFIFLRTVFSLFKIKSIIKNNIVEKIDSIHFINTTEPGTPFSFFRWLFWNKKIELASEKGEQIFRHELFHINQKHSWDIMYLELLTVIFWINPFFHLIKKETKAVHEFLADQFAVTENRKWEYAELLLMQVLNTQQQLVNPFFHNQLKRRIAMLTTSKNPSYQYLRKLMVFPVAAIVIGLFAFSYKEKKKDEENEKLFISNSKNLIDTTQKPSVTKIKWIEDFTPSLKKIPTSEQLKLWSDSKIYGVWLDNKRVSNIELSKYKASDFALYQISKLEKNATNYGKHFYQVGLWTNEAFEKMQTNKPSDTGKYLIVKDTTKPLLGNRFEKALIVIDGVIREDVKSIELDNFLSPNDIESVTVIKGGDAKGKYGEKGINGVIEIITKNRFADKNVQIEIYADENNLDKADKIFTKAEVNPSFSNGDAQWRKYLEINLDASVPRKHNAPESAYTTVIQFIVDKKGNITNVKPLTNQDYGMEEEAVRVIKAGPKWVPAMANGQPVSVYIKQAITFMVVNNKTHFSESVNSTSNEFNEVVVICYPIAKDGNEEKLLTSEINNGDKIFSNVEIEPSFRGGDAKFKKYVNVQLNQLIPVQKGAPERIYTVIIQFVVKTDSTITNIKALTNYGYGMEEEAIRLISKGPRWNPAIQNGHQVSAIKNQPITFVVNK